MKIQTASDWKTRSGCGNEHPQSHPDCFLPASPSFVSRPDNLPPLWSESSGVTIFNQDGVVYEKDLGKKTDILAKTMKEYNPIPVAKG
jgi:hypothetical protein